MQHLFKPSRPSHLTTLVAITLVAGCSATPTNEDVLARAAELNRRAQQAAEAQPAAQADARPADTRTRAIASGAGRPAAAADTAPQTAGAAATPVRANGAQTSSPPASAPAPTNAAPMADAATLPPNAKPGECYARVYVEPTYRTVTETVVKRPETTRIDIVPARFEKADERVMVKPADRRVEIIPARYDWVEERVLVKPESTRLVEVPPVTREVNEKVVVKAGYTTWKKGRGPIEKIDESTGEIMCLVEVPPVYDTITRTEVVTPAQVREEIVPAVYRSVRKQVMVEPTKTREVEIPAEFRQVKVDRLVDPAREVRVVIPAQTAEVQRREMVAPGRIEWREILCETNMTRERIRAIQTALRDAGFDPGPIDGIIANRTMQAVKAYQQSKGLPVDDHLNMKTVRALGVAP